MQQLRRVKSAILGHSGDISHLTNSDDGSTSPVSSMRETSFSPRRSPNSMASGHPHSSRGLVGRITGGVRPRKHSDASSYSVTSAQYEHDMSVSPSEASSGDVDRISQGCRSEACRSERTILPSSPKFAALKSAFDMIDTDKSGWISASELMDLLHFRGVAIKYYQALDVIKMYSSNFSDEISFRDFVKVMHDFEGAEVIDLTRAFGNAAAIKAQALERSLGARTDSFGPMSSYGSDVQNARLAFASIVDGPYVHGIVFILIIVDVFCVIAELLLVVTWCDDPSIPNHRRLILSARDLGFSDWESGDVASRSLAGAASNGTVAWCSDCATRQHDWEVVLHTISISILCVFAAQIFLVMVAYRLQFFKNVFFVLDAVVVGGALLLELRFHVREGALLVVLLTWRMGRIVHGLVTTVEIGNKRMHSRINQVLRAQLLTKAEGMKELKSRFTDLSVAEKDLRKIRKLLEPTDMTIENVETVSLDILRRNCKLQIMNNQEVLETLTSLAEELKRLEDHIKSEMDDASAAASRLDQRNHHRKSTLRETLRAAGHETTGDGADSADLEKSESRVTDSADLLRQITHATSVEVYRPARSLSELPGAPSGFPEHLELESPKSPRANRRRNTVF
mmetsp:Transcript_78318/g.122196  ORF Transcript_78318/g.122196 Transcript_78318/m.122196 type:complete len:625 (-) Transcript_78318:72-1946(-)